MTRHFDYCLSASEGDNQSVRSSAPVVSRCFPGGYNVKLYISRGRLAWWLLAFFVQCLNHANPINWKASKQSQQFLKVDSCAWTHQMSCQNSVPEIQWYHHTVLRDVTIIKYCHKISVVTVSISNERIHLCSFLSLTSCVLALVHYRHGAVILTKHLYLSKCDNVSPVKGT